MNEKKKIRKCLWCRKKTKNKKFCSNKCKYKYFKEHKIGAFFDPKIRQNNSKKAIETLKRLKKGLYDPKVRKKGRETCKKLRKGFYGLTKKDHIRNGKKIAIINKKNKTGFFDPNFHKNKQWKSNAGKIGGHNAQKILKKYRLGIYRLTHKDRVKIGKKAAITNRKNKTGLYDPKVRSMGGLIAQKVLRQNVRNLKYNGQYYDSKPEIEISLCLQKQYNYKPIEDKTLHIRIGKYEYDYKLKDMFIEYHGWFQNETEKEYFRRRRKILDKNGYKKYKLIVIT